jgi:hypothetical protein
LRRRRRGRASAAEAAEEEDWQSEVLLPGTRRAAAPPPTHRRAGCCGCGAFVDLLGGRLKHHSLRVSMRRPLAPVRGRLSASAARLLNSRQATPRVCYYAGARQHVSTPTGCSPNGEQLFIFEKKEKKKKKSERTCIPQIRDTPGAVSHEQESALRNRKLALEASQRKKQRRNPHHSTTPTSSCISTHSRHAST